MEMKGSKNCQIIYEAKVLKAIQGGGKFLKTHSILVGIPKLYWFGTEGDYNIMAMDFLGSNLEELMKELGCHFSLLTTLIVAD
jgi:hypothetical protein